MFSVYFLSPTLSWALTASHLLTALLLWSLWSAHSAVSLSVCVYRSYLLREIASNSVSYSSVESASEIILCHLPPGPLTSLKEDGIALVQPSVPTLDPLQSAGHHDLWNHLGVPFLTG